MSEKRLLSETEKKQVIEKHGLRCFIDGAPVEFEDIEFHHIKPYSKGGETSIDNMAPVCKEHHRRIRTLSLTEFKDKIELQKFFSEGDGKYLNDVIFHKTQITPEILRYQTDGAQIKLYINDQEQSYPLYTCPITQWQYFYAIISIKYLENDKELQPRTLRPPFMWDLYRHFLQNTQLSPSICRLVANKVLLFDGQHKAAAQVWVGRSEIECKVYIEPVATKLKETNLEAHGKFRQMSFYSHELMKKYADIFKEDLDNYLETEGTKSEAGFVRFLVNIESKTASKAKNEISNCIYQDILYNEENKLGEYIAEKNRSRKQPLAFNRVKKTFFKEMLYPPPVDVDFESVDYYRKQEKDNLVKLMNIITEELLTDKWNPQLNDNMHKKTERIFSAGAVRAWVILLKDTINQHLHHYSNEERRRFFFRNIENKEFVYFRNFVKKISTHKIWDDPDQTGEIRARLSKDDATTAKNLFAQHNLTVDWVLGNPV